MDSNENFTVANLAVKCRSKSELYNLLTREEKIYLSPSKQDATQSYLRDILRGDILHLKWSQITVIKVSQYKGLRVKDIIKFASTQLYIFKFLSKCSYNKEPNREWLWNIVNSLMTSQFNKFIETKIDTRNIDLILSQNIGISTKPEFIEIFKKSQSISSIKGGSHFLERTPKQSKDQLKIRQLEEEKVNNEYKSKVFKLEIDELKTKLKKMEEQQLDTEDNIERLGKLYELGLIDENGELINNKME